MTDKTHTNAKNPTTPAPAQSALPTRPFAAAPAQDHVAPSADRAALLGHNITDFAIQTRGIREHSSIEHSSAQLSSALHPLSGKPLRIAVEQLATKFPLSQSLLREIAQATRHGPVEFGSITDPSRTVEHLAAEAATGDVRRASLQGNKLVLPGLRGSLIGTISRTIADFGARLSTQLPYRKYRLNLQNGNLTLDGKINPWVRMIDNELRYSTHTNQPIDEGWKKVKKLLFNNNNNFIGGIDMNDNDFDEYGRIIKTYDNTPNKWFVQKHSVITHTDDEGKKLVLPIKSLNNPHDNKYAFGGGMPALPGGNQEINMNENETLTKEVDEELRKSYTLAEDTIIRQGSKEDKKADYKFYSAKVNRTQGNPEIPDLPEYKETERDFTFDIDASSLNKDSTDEEILKDIVKNADIQLSDPMTDQQKQFFHSHSFGMLCNYIRSKKSENR